MRYIGNKTKLLPFIGGFLDDIELREGRALDAFAGTASVGSYLKQRGFSVVACDIMSFSYVFQRAYIVADDYPMFDGLAQDDEFQQTVARPDFASRVESRFEGQGDLFASLAEELRPLEEVLVFLDTYLAPVTSFITRNYSTSHTNGDGERMFFTRRNGRQIDAIRHRLEDWYRDGAITDDEFYIVLAALIEAADAVANTTGVYAAFVKSWQGNALRPLRLALPPLVVGTGRECSACRANINEVIGELGHFDLIYLDPPYNTRQYSGYYHVPEVIAEGWFEGEPELRGKTGLIPDEKKKSAWSTREGCVPALEDLLTRADATHVLLSYNNEGIIPESEIERLFRERGQPSTYRRVGRDYKRYRADADSGHRQYKGDRTTEYLYYARLA